MAKKANKLTYKDFLQPTLSDKPSQLFLSSEGGVTDFYLDVLSEKNPKVKRAITKYGLVENRAYIDAGGFDDEVDGVIFAQEKLVEPRKELATALVSGGNFDNYIEVLDNPINCDVVIQRAYDSGEYLEKKA